MRNRHKAICPVLGLVMLVAGAVTLYLSAKEDGFDLARAEIQACEQARDRAEIGVGGPDRPGSEPGLESCERRSR